jgi:hypothetical protein
MITLIVFASLIFVISFIGLFTMTSTTERYKNALHYLDDKNDGTIYSKFPLPCFKEKPVGYDFTLSDFIFYSGYNCYTCYNCFEYYFTNAPPDERPVCFYCCEYNQYCIVNKTILNQMSGKIEYQSDFKNWKAIELCLNLIRFFYTTFVLVYKILIFIFNYTKKKIDSNDKLKFFTYLSAHFLVFIFLPIIKFILTVIYMAKLANPSITGEQIGLYPEKQGNDFIVNQAICYVLDIVIYFFSGISFVIAIILKVAYNRQNNQQQSNDQARVITYNNAQIYNIQTQNREPFPQEINVHSEAKMNRPNSKENEN